MSAFSDYMERKILDCLTGQGGFTSTTMYISLHTADPTDTGTGTEVSGGSYARTSLASKFPATSGTTGTLTNNADITFPTATGSWGTVTHFAIWDASTTGNPLMYGAFTTSKTYGNGDVAKIPSGQLTLTVA